MIDNTINLDPRGRLTRSELAAAGWLARYSGATRKNYRHIISPFFAWCADHGLEPIDAHRAHLELWLRHCEENLKNKPATIFHKAGVLRSFYDCAVIDDVLVKSPAAHLKTPRFQSDDARLVMYERSELTALIHAAQRGTPVQEGLVTLLLQLGLRIHEACNVRIEDFTGSARGHQVLTLVGKGNKAASIPLTVPVLRSLHRAAGDRTEGPLLLRDTNGDPMTRAAAARILRNLGKQIGLTKDIRPHLLRHAYVTSILDAGVPLRRAQVAARHADPRTTMKYDRAMENLDQHANYVLSGYLAGTL